MVNEPSTEAKKSLEKTIGALFKDDVKKEIENIGSKIDVLDQKIKGLPTNRELKELLNPLLDDDSGALKKLENLLSMNADLTTQIPTITSELATIKLALNNKDIGKELATITQAITKSDLKWLN